MVGRDALGHARLDRLEVAGCQRAGQLEVVVEAVGDRGPDPELGTRDEIEDRLGHDVGRRVAHRVQLVVGAGVQQLFGRASLGRLELLFLSCRGRVDRRFRRALVGRFAHQLLRHSILPRITTPLVHRQDERCTPAVPPAFTAVSSRALVPR